MEKPIFVMPTETQIVGEILISGYIHNQYDFNRDKLNRIPQAIDHLIAKYHTADQMRILDPYSLGGDFEWRFHTQSDISQFLNLSDTQILQTAPFMMNECLFRFEISRNEQNNLSLRLVSTSLPPEIQSLSLKFTVKCKEIGVNLTTTAESVVTMDSNAFTDLQRWTFEIQVILRSMLNVKGEMIRVREQWMARIKDLAQNIWIRHETKDSAIEELRNMLNAPKQVAESLAKSIMDRIEQDTDFLAFEDFPYLQRRQSITDLGDMHIIPNDYFDHLLEDSTAFYEDRKSRQEFVQKRLQRHLPESVAATLSETLIQSINGEVVQNPDSSDKVTGRELPVAWGSLDDAAEDSAEEWQITAYPMPISEIAFGPNGIVENIGNDNGFQNGNGNGIENVHIKISGNDTESRYKQKNLSIFSMPEEIELVGDVLITGFVNGLYGFDAVQLDRTPNR